MPHGSEEAQISKNGLGHEPHSLCSTSENDCHLQTKTSDCDSTEGPKSHLQTFGDRQHLSLSGGHQCPNHNTESELRVPGPGLESQPLATGDS